MGNSWQVLIMAKGGWINEYAHFTEDKMSKLIEYIQIKILENPTSEIAITRWDKNGKRI